MAAITDDEFESALEVDFGWRRMEIVEIKRLLAAAQGGQDDSPKCRVLGRAAVTLSYAHWEGYSKNSLDRYSILIARRKPSLSSVAEGIALESMVRMLLRLKRGDLSARRDLISLARGKTDLRVAVDRTPLSDTRGNLRYNVLEELFERGALPIQSFETREQFINRSLCDSRNAVAHGRDMFLRIEEGLDLCDEVLWLMETLRDLLVDQVRSKKYLVDGYALSG